MLGLAPWLDFDDEVEASLDALHALFQLIHPVLDGRDASTHQGEIALHHAELILKR
jgi:hypothetical protein